MNVTNLKCTQECSKLLSLGEQLAAGKLIVDQDNNVYEVFRSILEEKGRNYMSQQCCQTILFFGETACVMLSLYCILFDVWLLSVEYILR